MAIGKKTGGRDFKPGQSGNPKGKIGLPQDLKEIRALRPSFVKNVIAKLSRMTLGELEAHIDNPYTSMMEITIGKVYLKAFIGGDHMRMNFLLDRSIGKVKDEIDMNLKPIVTFKTSMTEDGRMLQDLIKDEVESARSFGTTDSDS